MGLKHKNPNGGIVQTSKFNLVQPFFLKKMWNFQLEMNPMSYFFKKMFRLPKKQKNS